MREWTIDELHDAYRAGATDPVAVCAAYLARIEAVDRSGPTINAVIEVNPDALAIARERAAEINPGPDLMAPRGLLHGIPILLKDNVDTGDRMQTTAGSLALVDQPQPAADAFLVQRLRAEGAVILGKTNLSEWANFRSTSPTSGWSSRGGQTVSAYALDRTPCGSSSGSGAAIAANLAVAAVGTETDGSVTCPAAHCSLVGVKPTMGIVSRTGIIPISASQDTAGPMARTVRDAAIVLQAMAGADPDDEATRTETSRAGARRDEATRGEGHPGDGPTRAPADFLAYLDVGALRGMRIGVARNCVPGHRGIAPLFTNALAAMAGAGAHIVDPADLPDFSKAEEHELTVLRYEFRHGLAAYFARRLAGRGAANDASALIRTIDDVIAFNEAHADAVLRYFGQEEMISSAACGSLSDERYREALRESRRLAGPEGLGKVLSDHRLDAIVAPTNGPSWLIDHVNGDHYTGGAMSTGPAISGSPHVTVPMGYVHGLPIGISFAGRAHDDARLLGMAYAFEQAFTVRRAPDFRATVFEGWNAR